MSKRVIVVGCLFFMTISSPVKAEGFLFLPLQDKQPVITTTFCDLDYIIPVCHKGTDYDTTDDATPVLAATVGKVVKIKNGYPSGMCKKCGFGNHIIILHPNGYKTIYAHLLNDSLQVAVDAQVIAGQKIALADNSGFSTGSHLHFEVVDPSGTSVDPYPQYPNCGSNALWATCPPVPYDSSFDDKDEDGYTISQGDCDDNNPNINPDAQEVCDHQDNDCNNQTDEYWVQGLASDLGKPCTVGISGCQNKGSMVCTADGLATVCSVDAKPPSMEICDSLDNDCDGKTDEDWKIGLAQDLGNPCTVGLGACQNQGVMICTLDGLTTVCSVDALPPSCEDQECGDDGCGGSCGECSEQAICQNYQCCQPNCQNKKCGYDGCGGSCGTCLNWQYCDNGDCVSLELIDCSMCHEIADPCDPPFICVSTPKYNSYSCHIPCTTNADCPNFYCGIGSGGALGTKPSVCYTCPADF